MTGRKQRTKGQKVLEAGEQMCLSVRDCWGPRSEDGRPPIDGFRQ